MEEKTRQDKEAMQWQLACAPELPDMVIGKWKAIQEAEKRHVRNDTAMDMVIKMRDARGDA